MKSVQCYTCNKQGHISTKCPENKSRSSRSNDGKYSNSNNLNIINSMHIDKRKCRYCDSDKHLTKECDMLLGEKEASLLIGKSNNKSSGDTDHLFDALNEVKNNNPSIINKEAKTKVESKPPFNPKPKHKIVKFK